MQQGLWLISFFLITAGCILFVSGIAVTEYRNRKSFYRGKAYAKVVQLDLQEDQDLSASTPQFHNVYYPVIEYYAEGKLFSSRLEKGTYPSEYKIGDEVLIAYLEGDPEEYMIVPMGMSLYLPIILDSAGVVMILIGALFFIRFAFRT